MSRPCPHSCDPDPLYMVVCRSPSAGETQLYMMSTQREAEIHARRISAALNDWEARVAVQGGDLEQDSIAASRTLYAQVDAWVERVSSPWEELESEYVRVYDPNLG